MNENQGRPGPERSHLPREQAEGMTSDQQKPANPFKKIRNNNSEEQHMILEDIRRRPSSPGRFGRHRWIAHGEVGGVL
ncbi:MAG: hypothetical protein LBE86_02770 [Gemmobacter sp.]|nr:hypothetical protein [Gemmobacter sp.]